MNSLKDSALFGVPFMQTRCFAKCKRTLLAIGLVLVFARTLAAQVVINELDSDTPGADVLEFIELYDGGMGNTSLDGFVLVFFNGSNDSSYRTIDLTGFETNAGGFFVLGNSAVANVDSVIGNNALQNGADAVALYAASSAEFPNDSPITIDGLVDAIVYGASADSGLIVLLNPGQSQVSESSNGDGPNHSLQRIPNGEGGARNTDTYVAIPPTPGAENIEPPVVEWTLTTAVNPTNGGSINRDPDQSIFTDGESVELTATANPGFVFSNWSGDIGAAEPTTNPLTLTMDQDRSLTANFLQVATNVIINEMDAETPGSDELEFIELYDGGSGQTDLTGLVVVLFNGSNDLSYGAFDLDGHTTNADGFFVIGNASVANVDSVIGNNALQNGADAIALYAGNAADFPNSTQVTTDNLIDAIVYDTDDVDDAGLLALLNSGQPQVNENGGGDAENHSLQRIPNGEGGARNTDTYVAIPPTPGAENIEPPVVEWTLTTAVNPTTGGSINRDPDQSIFTDGESVELTAEANAFFVFANWSGDIGAADPTTNPLTLTMDQDRNLTANFLEVATNVIINEMDAETPGSDELEFIELYDGGSGQTDLTGLVVVLFNGSNDLSYGAFDLDGHTTNADGFFVLGNSAVANVDLVISNNALQNGADAIALFAGNAAGFPNSTQVTTDNLIDAIVYDTDDVDDAGLLALLNSGQPQVNENGGGDAENHSLQRIPNGEGGARNTDTYVAIPPTPGAENIEPPVVEWTLTTAVSPTNAGSINRNPDQSIFTDGESVELTATANPGFVFANWSGDIGAADPIINPLTLTMDQDRSITANFLEVATNVIINEMDAETPGSDELEFIELYDGGVGNTDLTGLVIVLFNGTSDLTYGAFDLDGHATNADGFFVLGNSAVGNVDLVISNNALQNGADAIALFAGNTADFPNGTAITTDNLLDTIVYDTDDADDSELLVLLNSGQPQMNENGGGDAENHSLQRIPNGEGGARNTDSYLAIPPTPGAENIEPPVIEWTLTTAVSPTNGGSINRDPDESIFTDGESVELTATANPGFVFANWSGDIGAADPTTNPLTVVMDQDRSITANLLQVATNVIINEMDAETPGSDELEFIELYDGGVGNTDLTGLIVVLFNGTSDLTYGAFDLDGHTTNADGFFVLGNSAVANVDLVIPNNALQNGADAIALFAGNATDFPNGTQVTTDNLIDAIVYDTDDADDSELLVLLNSGQPQMNENGGGDAENHSLQRIPNGEGGARNTDSYLAIPPTPGAENIEPPVVEWTLTTSVSPTNGGSINRDPDQSIFTDGESVELTATANPGFVFSNWSGDIGAADPIINPLMLTMDQDRSITANFLQVATNVIINEMDAETPGSDELEFIELYDGGVGNTDLTGLVVVLFNGSNDLSYGAFDLDGHTTNADGFFVLGNSAVGNVDLVISNNALQNGADAIALFAGNAADFPNSTQVTTDNLIDAIVYNTDDVDDAGLLALLNSGQPQVNENGSGDAENHSLQRIPNGEGGARNTDTYVAIPPTPGAENSLPTAGIVATPDSLFFGRVRTGLSKDQTLIFKNAGAADLEITSIRMAGSAADQFEVRGLEVPLILESEQSHLTSIRFSPKSAGTKSARLEVTSNDQNQSLLIVKLRGEGQAAPRIAVSTDTLDFGSVEIGDERELSLTLRNAGSADLVINKIRLLGRHDSNWVVESVALPFVIPAGSSIELAVSFKPIDIGEKTAVLEISSNDPGNHPVTITLVGSGFHFGPSLFAGKVVINEIHYNPAATQGNDNIFEFIELANTDSLPIVLDQFSFLAGVSHTFTVFDTLPGNGFVVVAIDSAAYPGSIQWTAGNLVNSGELIQLIDPMGAAVDSVIYDDQMPWPSEPNGGGPSLELKNLLLDNRVGENWQASLIFGGTPGFPNSVPDSTEFGPKILAIPSSLEFGDVQVGDSLSLAVEISNIGDAVLEVAGITLADGTSEGFAIVASADSQLTIAPGDSEIVVVIYRPTQTGSDTGALEIASNDSAQPLLTVTLSGNGVDDVVSEFAGVVVINEIHYNPSTLQGPDADFEFIELHNTADEAVSLAGFAFVAGIAHTFGEGDTLAAGGHLVLASSAESYAGSIDWQSGSLLNTGETLQLVDARGATVDLVEYNDTAPWPTAPNGDGPSLQLRDPLLDNNLAESWQASSGNGGTPGTRNTFSEPAEVSDLVPQTPREFFLAQNYPNPFNPTTNIRFELPQPSAVTLTLFDITGRQIRALVTAEDLGAGVHAIVWDGRDDNGTFAATGIYLYRIVVKSRISGQQTIIQTKKMLLLK